MATQHSKGGVFKRMLRILMGRINRRDVLTYLFFVFLAAVFWAGVTMHDEELTIESILKQIQKMQFA